MKFSNITLKIKGIGNKNVFYSNFSNSNYPNIIYINGIKQSKITSNYYFNLTDNYVKLIWNDSINNCEKMFCGCSSINEIDLSNFDTSEITNMYGIFYGCSSLTSLNLSNFNTSIVTDMSSMFSLCSSLTSLNLSNFNTSIVKDISFMFSHCSSLTSLNLSNFNTSIVIYMSFLFTGCLKLQYINLKNFLENMLIFYSNIFNNVPNNIVVCINESNNNIISQLANKICYVNYCLDDWQSKQKKLINGKEECIDNCENHTTNKYEYIGKCYIQCPYGNITDDNNPSNKNCKCEMNKCLTCSKESLSKGLCTQCNYKEGFYPKENDPLNTEKYTECYNTSLQGYYLDFNEKVFKECFHTCESCKEKGENLNHNCTKCSSDFPLEYRLNDNDLNCFTKCSRYYFFDINNRYYCTSDFNCPDDYPILIEGKNECIHDNKYDSTYINRNESIIDEQYGDDNNSNSKDYIISNNEIKLMVENILNNEGNLTEIKKYNLMKTLNQY